MPKLRIIYDGQCRFCVRALGLIRRLAFPGALEFYDSHDPETLGKKFPWIRPQDAEEAMIAVTEEGRACKGFYAFRQLIWRAPALWLLAPFFYLPGSSFAGTRLYAWVAKNRRRLGCRVESGAS